MEKLVTLVPLFPLAGFLYITFFGKGLSKQFIGTVASGTVLLSFITSIMVFSTQMGGAQPTIVHLFEWIKAGTLHLDIAFLVDPLSTVYIMFVTGVSFLIHVYSIGYMHDDEGYNRFMAYLNLFVFFMLLLVLADNYAVLFVGWEGVGVCSYLLIGFWYKDMANNDAAKKSFILNRIGDFSFILGMAVLFAYAGTLSFDELYISGSVGSALPTSVATSIGIFFFIGATAKSAQIPLHTWLPDAMAGPTPVSALIHAATMVTAGVYLIARSSGLYEATETASQIVMWIGIFTSIFGATVALTQNDIKKVLAYSTVSQLGLMFVALGLGAYSTAVFHVVTHAFFKALLFLGAGSVIHAMGGEQDIRGMGGLRKAMPTTHWTFLIASLAISGVFPLAGFFSKDQILAVAFENNMTLFVLGSMVSALTAFYMFRLYFLTFHGEFRGTEEQNKHLHESPKVMTIPLVVLAILSIVGGFIGLPHKVGESLGIHWHWLDRHLGDTVVMPDLYMPVATEIILMLVALSVALGSIYYAWLLYKKRGELALEDDQITSPAHKLLAKKYWIDEIYDALIRKPLDAVSNVVNKVVDPKIVDGFVEGVAKMNNEGGGLLRKIQTGHLTFYVLVFIIGLIALLIFI